MSLHKEISFEDEICHYLGANGWPYAEGDAASYDRALFPANMSVWVWQGIELVMKCTLALISAPVTGPIDVRKEVV